MCGWRLFSRAGGDSYDDAGGHGHCEWLDYGVGSLGRCGLVAGHTGHPPIDLQEHCLVTRRCLCRLANVRAGWLMFGLQQEVSAVDAELARFALSRFRRSTISSRDHEESRSLWTTMSSKGGVSCIASQIIHSKSSRTPMGRSSGRPHRGRGSCRSLHSGGVGGPRNLRRRGSRRLF